MRLRRLLTENIKFGLILIQIYCTSGLVYGQEQFVNHKINIIEGKVIKVDMAGNIIDVQTNLGEQSFHISDQAKKIRDTHDIGLLDIKEGDPVTIQYESPSLGENEVMSIEDNKPEDIY